MASGVKKLSKNVVVVNDLGLHARVAAKIAELAKQAESPVWIIKDGRSVDATGILDILTLECSKQSKLTIKIDNSNDIGTLNAIVALIETGCKE
jgi:phosphocarrier protein HPr